MNTISFDTLPKAFGEMMNKIENIERLLSEKKDFKLKPKVESFLTVKETAKYLNLTVPTIYSKVSRGEIPSMKKGKRLYFSYPELLNYIKSGRKKTNSEIEAEASNYVSQSEKVA